MEIKKEFIYLQNAFNLFLVKHLDRIRIAAHLTAKIIKTGFKFAYAYPFERTNRDECYKNFCDELQKDLNRGLK
jgi:hypothetical protein